LREGLSTRAVPQPCSVVIFGATGDLTHRKLLPALYNLAADGELPPAVTVIGFARREKTDEDFRREMEEAVRKFSRQTVRDEIWKTLASQFLSSSDFSDEPASRVWPNAWTRSTRNAARVATGYFISRSRPTNSSRSSSISKPSVE